MKNIIVSKMTATDWKRFDDLLDQMETMLEGKLVVLDENGRVRYGSVNEQNKLLINKVWQYRQSKPAMSSPDVDWQTFEEDYKERERLETRGDRVSSIAYRFKSTKIRTITTILRTRSMITLIPNTKKARTRTDLPKKSPN